MHPHRDPDDLALPSTSTPRIDRVHVIDGAAVWSFAPGTIDHTMIAITCGRATTAHRSTLHVVEIASA